MTEPNERELRQWNEVSFIKRIAEATQDSEREISTSELPLTINAPSLNRVGDRALKELEPRMHLHAGSNGFSVAGNQEQTECFFMQMLMTELVSVSK